MALKAPRGLSSGKTVLGQTMPQVSVGGSAIPGAKNNPEMAKRTADLLLSETKATLPGNVQAHINHQSKQAAEKSRREMITKQNVFGRKSYE